MNWHDLVSALTNAPALPGALCRGRAPLFDAHHDLEEIAEQRAERITVAQALCDQCPALTHCRDWARLHLDELSGVVAGELHETGVTVGRLDTRRPPNAVVEFVCGRESSTVTDVAAALDISRTTAATALSRAARAGSIYRSAPGKYTGKPSHYRIEVSA